MKSDRYSVSTWDNVEYDLPQTEYAETGSRLQALAERLQLICIFYIIAWILSPPLIAEDLYGYIAMLAAAIWFIVELVGHPSTFIKPSRTLIFVILFILYSGIVGYMTDGGSGVTRNIQMYLSLLFLIFYDSHQRRDIRKLRLVVWASLVIFSIWLVTTLVAYQVVQNASRILIRSGDVEADMMRQGIGGYGLVYGAMIIIPVLLYLLKTHILPVLTFKIAALAALILSIFVVIQAGYSIALILMMAGIIITLMIGKATANTLVKTTIVITVVLLALHLFGNAMLDFVVDSASGTSYEHKLQDIRASLESNRGVGTVDDRMERYLRSLHLFIENPVIGTLSYDHIGKHSAIIDTFAFYGVIVGYIFAYILFQVPLSYLSRKSSKAFGMSLAMAVVIIAFSCLDQMYAGFGFFVFIFYPVAMSYVEDNEAIQELSHQRSLAV